MTVALRRTTHAIIPLDYIMQQLAPPKKKDSQRRTSVKLFYPRVVIEGNWRRKWSSPLGPSPMVHSLLEGARWLCCWGKEGNGIAENPVEATLLEASEHLTAPYIGGFFAHILLLLLLSLTSSLNSPSILPTHSSSSL